MIKLLLVFTVLTGVTAAKPLKFQVYGDLYGGAVYDVDVSDWLNRMRPESSDFPMRLVSVSEVFAEESGDEEYRELRRRLAAKIHQGFRSDIARNRFIALRHSYLAWTSPGFWDALDSALAHPDPATRRCALHVLGQLKTPESWTRIEARFSSEVYLERYTACMAALAHGREHYSKYRAILVELANTNGEFQDECREKLNYYDSTWSAQGGYLRPTGVQGESASCQRATGFRRCCSVERPERVRVLAQNDPV